MNKKIFYAISAIAIVSAFYLFSKTQLVDSSGKSAKTALNASSDNRSFSTAKVDNYKSSDSISQYSTKSRGAYKSPDAARIPDGNLAGNLSLLKSQAYSGHPEIAYALARDLFACYGKSQNDSDAFPTDPSTSYKEKCRGLTNQDFLSAVNLLTYAAQSGDVNAQNSYMGEIGSWIDKHPELQYKSNFTSNYARNSLIFLQRAAASGNVDAMISLATVYNSGIITNRNPVDAYAYMYAASKTGLIPASQRLLSLWQHKLPPSDVAKGVSRGEAIYLNCCTRM